MIAVPGHVPVALTPRFAGPCLYFPPSSAAQNGFLYCNAPAFQFQRGQRVRWYLFRRGTAATAEKASRKRAICWAHTLAIATVSCLRPCVCLGSESRRSSDPAALL